MELLGIPAGGEIHRPGQQRPRWPRFCRGQEIAATATAAHDASISPVGAPDTPMPATTVPAPLIGSPPGRMLNPGIETKPGWVAAALCSAAVGTWNPAAAYAFSLLTSTVAPVAVSARCWSMTTPSRSTMVTETG